MKRFLPFASLACFALVAGCGDGTDPTNPNNPNPSDVPSLPERDGLPSTGNASRLLYYISTHEDAPGLYAVQPSEPTAAPTYIDPEINLVRPFFHTVHAGISRPEPKSLTSTSQAYSTKATSRQSPAPSPTWVTPSRGARSSR